MILRIYTIFFSFMFLPLASQVSNISIGAKIHRGYLMAHTPEIKYFVEDYITGGELILNFHTTGKHYWQQAFRYPNTGIGLYYSNLSNNRKFGKAIGLYSYFKSSFGDSYSKFSFQYQVALGLTHITKKYDTDNLYLNLAIGTYNNVFIKFGFDTDIRLNKKITLVNSLNFIHFSNGKVMTPNLGLNIATFSTGINYQVNRQSVPVKELKQPAFKKHRFEVYTSAGIKAPSKYIYKAYTAYSLTIDYGYRTSYKRMWGAGLDFFYDNAIKPAMIAKNKQYRGHKDKIRMGTHAFHDVFIGDLVITLQLGYYYYNNFFEFTNLYTRTGLKYHFNKNISVKMALKAHYANADFVEWGIGYRW